MCIRDRLGIMSATDLARAEYKITNLRIAELTVTPVAGTFDLDHLKAIHKHLFSDVYELSLIHISEPTRPY